MVNDLNTPLKNDVLPNWRIWSKKGVLGFCLEDKVIYYVLKDKQ